jgi:RNA polymerase sigma factor FliA
MPTTDKGNWHDGRRDGIVTGFLQGRRQYEHRLTKDPRTGGSCQSRPSATSRTSGSNTRRTKAEALRNILMENYLHLVRYNAERIHVKLPDEVELDDLMSAGIFGLMDAIARSTWSAASSLRPIARRASAGRSWTNCARWTGCRAWCARGPTSSTRHQERLEVELGRSPPTTKWPAAAGLDGEFEKMAKDASAVGLVSLSRKWFETDSNKDVREIDVLEDKRGADPVREIQRKDLKELMTKGLSRPSG